MSESWDVPALRRRSEALFGSRHRLPTAVLVGDADGFVYARALATDAGIDPKEAGRQLEALEKAELVERTQPPEDFQQEGPGRTPTFFRRRENDFWTCLMELAESYRAPAG